MSVKAVDHSCNFSDQFNRNSIDRIKDLRSDQIEVNLFIGRSPLAHDLPLPISTDKKVVWASLSLDPIDETTPIDPHRIHLILNCNKSDQMQRIQGLFRLVVIDLSTTKFFDFGTLEHLSETIALGGDLILPSEFKTLSFYLNDNQTEPPFETNHFSLSVPKTKQKEHYEKLRSCWKTHFETLSGKPVEDSSINANVDLVANSDAYKAWAQTETFPKWMALKDRVTQYLYFYAGDVHGIQPPSYEDEKRGAREQTKEFLLKLFGHVEIFHQSYPYPNRYDNDGEIPSFYFYASGKKA
jgi:hypothetical protein